MSQDDHYDIVPAHLDFLSIYSPDLPEDSQLVFHYSQPEHDRRRRAKRANPTEAVQQQGEDDRRKGEHRRMRQIGLAQGMINFARSFSGTKDVDSIETEKNRIVVAELEKGWWILASIRLTRITTPTVNRHTPQKASPAVEHSSREVSPPVVLVQQLRRAYRIFKLHHTYTLSDLFVKLPHARFCTLLENYWQRFAISWDVLLHDNAIADAFDGLRVAGGGELGIGVGEEEFGSAERDYLEEIVRTTDGLRDLVVYRSPRVSGQGDTSSSQSPELAEGVIFSGIHSLGTDSIQALSEWLSQLGTFGMEAYGVANNPISSRNKAGRPRPKKQASWKSDQNAQDAKSTPLSDQRSPTQAESRKSSIPPSLIPPPAQQKSRKPPPSDGKKATDMTDKTESGTWMTYLTLGYGTQWGGVSKKDGEDDAKRAMEKTKAGGKAQEHMPQFLIGWKGSLEEPVVVADDADEEEDNEPSERLSIRVVHVEAYEKPENVRLTDSNIESSAQEEEVARHAVEGRPMLVKKRLRTVVYQYLPFTFAFVFEPDSASLSMSTFYRELHQKLVPLHKALMISTSPDRVIAKLRSALPQQASEASATPVFDLIFDPLQKIIRSSLPNIPSFREDQLSSSKLGADSWSRLEALNVYTHVLSLLAEQGSSVGVGEQSVKTTRNWWITWLRLPVETLPENVAVDGTGTSISETRVLFRDAILVRKATEHAKSSRPRHGATSSLSRLSLTTGTAGLNRLIGREASSSSESSEAKQSDKSGLVENTAVDPRRYVEALLNLSR